MGENCSFFWQLKTLSLTHLTYTARPHKFIQENWLTRISSSSLFYILFIWADICCYAASIIKFRVQRRRTFFRAVKSLFFLLWLEEIFSQSQVWKKIPRNFYSKIAIIWHNFLCILKKSASVPHDIFHVLANH